ncbi:MAG: adenine phosphoribosyltransferase [Candidatus Sumerlaeaceae bacterium]|nr:adenine phosphoribosyltransferase [Candidatus Sumerlaeaceae bacterium]
MNLKSFIRDVPDFPKPGIIFKDITPLLGDAEALRYAIKLLADRYRPMRIAKVAGIESRGFIFAAALACELGCGMVPIRKAGKLPYKTIRETYELEYGTDTIEIHADAVARGQRVVLLDDVIATGGTLAASTRLLQGLGAEVVEVACIIELTFLHGRDKLGPMPFHSLIAY